ncbi:hypothetical protein [Endozoicomonas sp. ALC020]
MDSRLRGNDESEVGVDKARGGTGQCGSGSESVWIPAFAGMT